MRAGAPHPHGTLIQRALERVMTTDELTKTESDTLLVRRARESDIPALIEMGRFVQAEGDPLCADEIDEPYLTAHLLEFIDTGMMLVAEYGGVLVGVMAFHLARPIWNPNVFRMHNAVFHVDPAHRQSGVADALITAAKDMANRMPNVSLIVGICSSIYPELKDRYMRSRGMKYIGGMFIFEGVK